MALLHIFIVIQDAITAFKFSTTVPRLEAEHRNLITGNSALKVCSWCWLPHETPSSDVNQVLALLGMVPVPPSSLLPQWLEGLEQNTSYITHCQDSKVGTCTDWAIELCSCLGETFSNSLSGRAVWVWPAEVEAHFYFYLKNNQKVWSFPSSQTSECLFVA